MKKGKLTYKNLFALLMSLGFIEETEEGSGRQGARVFFHEPTETILLFRNKGSQEVSPADILSTEVHLQAKGIVRQPLESLFSSLTVNK